ncbi:hypothetical protein [Sporosarcina jiandibaonis]|uniref:hypothetical protein n=1 Tax=Sporosarcina jiandibaonis TaxID=2715535 RepID=UPI00155347AB|nr:hypothetical protein [Sporosarcina jiandibaonis]
MESIIPFIIMLVLGAIMSGKRNAKSTGENEAKPFTAGQKQPGSPVRKFKEVSAEMYKEIQREFQQETERQPERQTRTPERTRVTPLDVKPKAVAEKPIREPREVFTQRKSRLSHSEIKDEIAKKDIRLESLLPKSNDDLIKGVIFSEIFGAPKSKR